MHRGSQAVASLLLVSCGAIFYGRFTKVTFDPPPNVTYVLDGTGIQVTGQRTRVEGNHVALCQTGYQVAGTGVMLMRNTAAGNSTNYNLAAGNFGQFISPVVIPGINGSSGGVALGGDANANFSY